MPKAIFFNVPSSGHVNPSLPLTAELVRRGHELTYMLTESYRAKVEAAGAKFLPYAAIPDDYFEAGGLDGSNPPMTSRYMLQSTQDILPALLEIVRAHQPDYLLYDAMCPWGAVVGRILKLPSICSLALLIISTRDLLTLESLKTIVRTLPDFKYIRAASQISNQIGQDYNIKPLAVMQVFNAPADLTISYTSTLFQSGSDRLPDSIKFVGPSIEPRGDTGDFPFDQLDDRPLIYISLGTVINENPTFFKACLDAFKDSPYQVVMSIGRRIDPAVLGTIPANCIVRGFVPQLDILQRAALFITHAGMNSVHEGLYYDVPLLLVPQQDEQNLVALRTQTLGAGLRLKNQHATAANIRAQAERILADDSFRANAARIGESFRQGGGHRRAADEIAKLLA